MLKFTTIFMTIFLASLFTAAATPGTIALIQYDADKHFNQYAENIKNVTALADYAVAQSANILVFPEGSTYGYMDALTHEKWCLTASSGCLNVNSVAESVPSGKTTQYWSAYALQHKVYVLFNLPEKDGHQFYNTTGIVGPNGYIGKYRKRDLYVTDTYYAQAGVEEFVLETPYGKFGLIICMDINSNYMGVYRNNGADAVIIQSDWDEDPPEALNDYSYASLRFNIDLYASDVSRWDGTGKYAPEFSMNVRERNGLAEPAVGMDGVSLHALKY